MLAGVFWSKAVLHAFPANQVGSKPCSPSLTPIPSPAPSLFANKRSKMQGRLLRGASELLRCLPVASSNSCFCLQTPASPFSAFLPFHLGSWLHSGVPTPPPGFCFWHLVYESSVYSCGCASLQKETGHHGAAGSDRPQNATPFSF